MTVRTATRPATKFSIASLAFRRIVHTFHRPGRDVGLLATFGNDFREVTPFADHPGFLQQGLDTAEHSFHNSRGEDTRFYLSVLDTLDKFREQPGAEPLHVPIFITDGEDNLSVDPRTRKVYDPEAVGAVVFNYRVLFARAGVLLTPIVIGVGKGKQINEDALRTFSKAGGDFPFHRIDTFDQLEGQIAKAITEVVREDRVTAARVNGVPMALVEQTWHLHRPPMRFALVLDRSASMNRTEA